MIENGSPKIRRDSPQIRSSLSDQIGKNVQSELSCNSTNNLKFTSSLLKILHFGNIYGSCSLEFTRNYLVIYKLEAVKLELFEWNQDTLKLKVSSKCLFSIFFFTTSTTESVVFYS